MYSRCKLSIFSLKTQWSSSGEQIPYKMLTGLANTQAPGSHQGDETTDYYAPLAPNTDQATRYDPTLHLSMEGRLDRTLLNAHTAAPLCTHALHFTRQTSPARYGSTHPTHCRTNCAHHTLLHLHCIAAIRCTYTPNSYTKRTTQSLLLAVGTACA